MFFKLKLQGLLFSLQNLNESDVALLKAISYAPCTIKVATSMKVVDANVL